MSALDPGAGGGFSRRRFIDWLLGTSFGALLLSVAYPIARYISPPQVPEATTHEVEVGPVNDPELMEKGFKIIRFGEDPVIVVRVAEGDVRAFTATCTHLDCIVEYQKPEQRIYCNCHGGEYDLTGRNVAGPPPRPLKRLQVDLVQASSGSVPKIVVSRS